MKILPAVCLGIGLLLLILFPAFISTYWLTLLFTLLINISLAGGVNLLWGYAGYLNLGYMIFFGLGAYGTGLLILQGWPFLFGILVCLIAFLPLGVLLALSLFRLQGLYFSAAGLGLLILLEELVGKTPGISGGLEGLSLPLGRYDRECYLLALALAFISLLVNFILKRTKLGFQLKMIREDEKLAASIGIPVTCSKILAYLLGAALALIAGGIYIRQVGYIGPSSAFGLSVAIPPVIMALVGGGRRWWGPLLGALSLTGLQEILWTTLEGWVLSGYGIILIIIGVFQSGAMKAKGRT